MKRTKDKSQKSGKDKGKRKSKSKPKKAAPGAIGEVQKLVHLLQVNQVELEHQNQELRIAEEELEASRNKYVNLFDFSPIPYFALDADGIIKEVNLSAGRMFGLDRNKLVGRHISVYMPSEERSAFGAFLKSIFESSTKQSCAVRLMNKDKRVFHVRLEGIKSTDTLESGERCQIALIDLSEFKELENSFKELSEELELLKGRKDKMSE